LKERNSEIECNGNYEVENNFRKMNIYKCACEGVRQPNKFNIWNNTRYWYYIQQIYSLPYDENKNIQPCPFLYQYQIMRNLCLGKAIEQSPHYTFKKVKNYLIYINSPKCYIHNKVNNENYFLELSKYLVEKDRFSCINYSNIIETAKLVIQKDLKELNIFFELEKWINEKVELI